MILNYEGKIHRGIDTPEDLSVIRKYLESIKAILHHHLFRLFEFE